MSGRISVSAEELWLVRLTVLLQAARGPVSEESILAEFERRRISGVTASEVRSILASLAGKKLIRHVEGGEALFSATTRGRKAVIEAAARLKGLLDLPAEKPPPGRSKR